MIILLAVREDGNELAKVMATETNEKDAKQMLQFYKDENTWPEGFEALIVNTELGINYTIT